MDRCKVFARILFYKTFTVLLCLGPFSSLPSQNLRVSKTQADVTQLFKDCTVTRFPRPVSLDLNTPLALKMSAGGILHLIHSLYTVCIQYHFHHLSNHKISGNLFYKVYSQKSFRTAHCRMFTTEAYKFALNKNVSDISDKLFNDSFFNKNFHAGFYSRKLYPDYILFYFHVVTNSIIDLSTLAVYLPDLVKNTKLILITFNSKLSPLNMFVGCYSCFKD